MRRVLNGLWVAFQIAIVLSAVAGVFFYLASILVRLADML